MPPVSFDGQRKNRHPLPGAGQAADRGPLEGNPSSGAGLSCSGSAAPQRHPPTHLPQGWHLAPARADSDWPLWHPPLPTKSSTWGHPGQRTTLQAVVLAVDRG